MTSATIKLFLPHADARRPRAGEVSNSTGKALAAPRTELEDLLARDELESSGVYFLPGVNPDTGASPACIEEAEVIRERLKQHKAKDFRTSIAVFVSKDENLTKAHVRYLENVFAKDVEISSPSAAAAVLYGGSVNGLTACKDKTGRSLKELEET